VALSNLMDLLSVISIHIKIHHLYKKPKIMHEPKELEKYLNLLMALEYVHVVRI